MFFVILFSSLFSLAHGHAQGKLNCCLFVFLAVLFYFALLGKFRKV